MNLELWTQPTVLLSAGLINYQSNKQVTNKFTNIKIKIHTIIYNQLMTSAHFDLLRIIHRESYIKQSYIKHRLTLWRPKDPYRGRTAPLTSKRYILYIYSTNIGTEYFKHGIYSPFFSSSKCSLFHNSNVFGSCIIHILYTGVLKFKK